MPVIRYTGDKSAAATIAETATDSPFRIEFCNTEKRFLPGHVIEGRVVFLWNRRWRTVQGIYVRILCEGKIYSSSGKLVGGGKPLLEHTYFSKGYYVYGDGRHDYQIDATSFAAFPFMFTLPNHGLPQAFMGPYGSVQYYIEAIAKTTIDFVDDHGSGSESILTETPPTTATTSTATLAAISKETFTVNEYLNLNQSIPREMLAGPIVATFDNMQIPSLYSFLSAKARIKSSSQAKDKSQTRKNSVSAVKVVLKLTKRGFAPGEIIQFGIIVENNSRKYLSSINLEFQQIAKFISSAQFMKVDIKILEQVNNGPSINPKSTSTWESQLQIPDELPVTSATNSISCINIAYRLMIEIETGPMSRNLKADYPIIIGTIPFEHIPRRVRSLEHRRRTTVNPQDGGASSAERQQSSPAAAECPNYLDLAIVSSVEGGSTWRASASTPPPTYEEATTTTTTTTNKSKCYLSTFNILP